jgi:3-hydroxyisobutyrate dehydrogenase-like beta-hydroxyacid dehydrogenase
VTPPNSNDNSVGVVGVGHLGRPIAERLVAHGWQVAVLDTNPQAVEPMVKQGAIACTTPAEMARKAGTILLVVRTAQDVEDVLFGPGGIAEAAVPDSLICIVSTIALDDLHRIADRAKDRSLIIVDAAIGGGAPAVEKGAAAAMIGGSQLEYERAAGVFAAFCGDLIHVPGIGGGMRLKLIKNHLSYLTMMVGMEAAALARAAEIDLELVRRVIESSDLVKQFFYLYLDGANIDNLPPDAPANQIAQAKAMAELCRKDLLAARKLAEAGDTKFHIAELVQEQADRLFRVPVHSGDAAVTIPPSPSSRILQDPSA